MKAYESNVKAYESNIKTYLNTYKDKHKKAFKNLIKPLSSIISFITIAISFPV